MYLNRRGGRFGTRGASAIVATTLIRSGSDLVTVAEMLGHARLDQTSRYTLPTAVDREQALTLLPVDR